jgi:hydrogenase maturation protease
MQKTLILGYGNPDRQDDGVAWHVLAAIARRAGLPAPASPDDEFMLLDTQPALIFDMQLTPEMAETLANYQRVCFVDAHTGRVKEDVHCEEVKPIFQGSPLTHHLTPESCLALSASLYGKAPQSILVSVRGFHFEFEQSLSPETAALAEQAVDEIWNWLETS